jgi:hypothetical protein
VTIWTLFSATRRQWPMAVVGVLATLAGMFWAASSPGAYYQHVRVVFLPPPMPHSVNRYEHLYGEVVLAADRVARELGLDPRSPQPVSPEVTILEQGVRHGSIVRLPNSGGQWAYNYEDPVLDIEVAGGSRDEVARTTRELVTTIRERMSADQRAAAVPRALRIETMLSPAEPPVLYAHGSTGRALLAVLVLGVLLTLVAIVIADRWRRSTHLRARRPRRSAPQAPDRDSWTGAGSAPIPA